MRVTPSLRMTATRALRSAAYDPKNGVFMGWWGHMGSQTQKGIISYSLSANRQNPLAGTGHAAVFNVARRTYYQIFYWLPPILIAYATMNWATERNEYLNSKPGRLEHGDDE